MLNKLNYFGDNTSLHGVRHAFSLSYISPYKKIFWIIVLTACGFCASVILQSIMALYSGEAVSYLMDTNYINFETPFPAVTICQSGDTGQTKNYIAKNNLPKSLTSFFKDASFWYLKYCKTSCTCQINVTCVEDFLDAVRSIRSPCSELMTDCWFGGKHFACCERFIPTPTEYGVCFTFNSRLNGNVTTLSRRDGPVLPTLIYTVLEKFEIRVHSPEDMVSVAMENPLGQAMTIPLVTDLEMIFKADITTSDKSITPLSPAARTCLFPSEKPDWTAAHWNFSRYSFSTCMLYCRALAQYHYCNCTHHLMPAIRGLPYCGPHEIQCLSHHKEQFMNHECECPMACDEVNYKLVHIYNVRYSGDDVSETLKARGTRGVVRLAELPNSMVRRVEIRHTLGLWTSVAWPACSSVPLFLARWKYSTFSV
ncbi:pickpocket protein 19-like isoform X2 [Plodia interpunctella]|uniref:pickpocket protein 19-like isoform X2 n=1 Tax=Plodia interpunctella TaxID=58824 RepID=UPI002368D713|nr:pickpocket protein 19-like isoform X2 [Plodia interpunctella]